MRGEARERRLVSMSHDFSSIHSAALKIRGAEN